MPAPQRTVTDKVSDWLTAYNAIKDELTPPMLRQMSSHLIAAVPPEDQRDDLEAISKYVQQVNMAGGVTRLVMANDRQAATVAAMLTQSGVSRPTFSEDTE